MVLLKLVIGRKLVGELGDGVDIVQWVRKMTDSNKEWVLKVLDPRLPSVPLHKVIHVFYVAMLCVEEQAVERPTMCKVVQILTELPKPPSSKQGDLTIIESSLSLSNSLESPTTASKEPKDQHHPQLPPTDLLSIWILKCSVGDKVVRHIYFLWIVIAYLIYFLSLVFFSSFRVGFSFKVLNVWMFILSL